MPQLLTSSAASGAGAVFQWGGGNGSFEVSATAFGGATISLQAKNQDGTFTDVTGTGLTANGRVTFSLPPCSIRANATAAPTGANAAAWRIRNP